MDQQAPNSPDTIPRVPSPFTKPCSLSPKKKEKKKWIDNIYIILTFTSNTEYGRVTHYAEVMTSGKIGVIPIPVPKPFTDSMKMVSHSWLPGGTQNNTGNITPLTQEQKFVQC